MTYNKTDFFNATRGNRAEPGIMGPTLDGNEVAGAEVIIDAMKGLPVSWVAYALATAWHETAHTMLPRPQWQWHRSRCFCCIAVR